jgi:hypothetical protein
MCNIRVGRYDDPAIRKDYQGWVEPEDMSWIMYVRADGTPQVFLERDPDTGAIIESRNADGTPNFGASIEPQ